MSSVDVFVPCYRYGHFLRECVESALNQSDVNVRVMIIDDASPDNTAEVATDLVNEDSRVTYVRHSANKGHIVTYNEGIDWASADYMLLLSADDYLLPGALGRAADLMDLYPEVGFTFGKVIELSHSGTQKLGESLAEASDETGRRILRGLEFIELSGLSNKVSTCTAVVRTQLQKRLGGYRSALPHTGDMEMWLRFAAHAPVGFVDAYQGVYRRHGSNMSLGYNYTTLDGLFADLLQRKLAFDCFVKSCESALPNSEKLHRWFYRLLAEHTLRCASGAFNEGQLAASNQLSEFAVAVCPQIKGSLGWMKLTAKWLIGSRAWHSVRPAIARIRGEKLGQFPEACIEHRKTACIRYELNQEGHASGMNSPRARTRIVFVSTMKGDPWGGSEELWSYTAQNLVAHGVPVSASVGGRSRCHKRVLDLIDCGVDIWFRPEPYPVWKKARRALLAPEKSEATLEVQKLVTARPCELIVISEGGNFPPVDLLEFCIAKGIAFVVIVQANFECWWPDDQAAERYRIALPAARRVYFISRANLRLAEKQIGCELSNAEVIWNPFNVDFQASPAWPPWGKDGELHLASVARLDPRSKGQDILFEVLAGPLWATRRWRLFLYGDGPMRETLKREAQRLGLSHRIVFAGFQTVNDIWASNHVLVMPSRFEGLPLAMVEAMLCGRPVVATDVAGHSEIIEDGVTGFLADAPTVDSMAKALERLWARRADAEEMGRAASKRIRHLLPRDPVQIFVEKLENLTAWKGSPKHYLQHKITSNSSLNCRERL